MDVYNWLYQWLLSFLLTRGYTRSMDTGLVLMTPPVGREATPLPASPSTWPLQKLSITTMHSTILLQPGQHQLHNESQLRNMSCKLAIVGR